MYITNDASFSACGDYRYRARRVWDKDKPTFFIIGLNPSTTEAEEDNPTIRRCVGFAKANGCGALILGNLFAFRATTPDALKRAEDPIGPRNHQWLRRMHKAADITVAAWGVHGAFKQQDIAVRAILGEEVQCLGTTQAGHPRHPLYLKNGTALRRWQPI